MLLPYIMVFVGLLLILFEFYLPGGIMGASGGALLVLGIVFFAMGNDQLWHIALFTLLTVAALGFVIKFALWRIRTAKPEESVYLESDQEGFHAPHFNEDAIGKEGMVLSDLKPSGHILVEGKQLQAIAKAGYIEKGSKVVVIGGKSAYLIVKLIQDTKEEEKK